MDVIIESLKRLYENGKVTNETLDKLVKSKKISENDRQYIILRKEE